MQIIEIRKEVWFEKQGVYYVCVKINLFLMGEYRLGQIIVNRDFSLRVDEMINLGLLVSFCCIKYL